MLTTLCDSPPWSTRNQAKLKDNHTNNKERIDSCSMLNHFVTRPVVFIEALYTDRFLHFMYKGCH